MEAQNNMGGQNSFVGGLIRSYLGLTGAPPDISAGQGVSDSIQNYGSYGQTPGSTVYGTSMPEEGSGTSSLPMLGGGSFSPNSLVSGGSTDNLFSSNNNNSNQPVATPYTPAKGDTWNAKDAFANHQGNPNAQGSVASQSPTWMQQLQQWSPNGLRGAAINTIGNSLQKLFTSTPQADSSSSAALNTPNASGQVSPYPSNAMGPSSAANMASTSLVGVPIGPEAAATSALAPDIIPFF